MFASLLPTILWDINEKSARLTEKKLQDDKYKVYFKGLKTKLHDNFEFQGTSTADCSQTVGRTPIEEHNPWNTLKNYGKGCVIIIT